MKLAGMLAGFCAAVLTAAGQPGLGIRSVQVSPRYEPEVREPSGQIRDLINQLGNSESGRSQEALKALLELGPRVEPELRWALQRETPAVTFPFLSEAVKSNRFLLNPELRKSRSRLLAIEEALSHVEEQRILRPTRVNLQCTNALLTNAVADLGIQAQAPISVGAIYWGPLDWVRTQRVSLTLSNATYWEALAQLNHQEGLGELYMNRNELLLVSNGGGMMAIPNLPAKSSVVSGPLRISVSRVELTRSLSFENGLQSNHVRLTLSARAEPKFWNSGPHAMVRVEVCEDDQGRSLLGQPFERFVTNESLRSWLWEIPIETAAPEPGRRIKVLKGRFGVEWQTEQRYLAVTNLLHAAGEKRGLDGMAMLIRKVDAEADCDSVHVEISAPHNSPYARSFCDSIDCCNLSVFDEVGVQMYIAPMYSAWVEARVALWDVFRGEDKVLVPQAGRRLAETREEGGREIMSWWLHFSRRVKPETLLWLTPPGTRWLTVPFEIEDIELPGP